MRALSRRLVATFAALDLTFKVLVGLAFLMVMGATDAARRGEILSRMFVVVGPAWVIWIGVLSTRTRAIDAFLSAEREGKASNDVVRRASFECTRLPLWVASLWSLEWAGSFGLVAALSGTGSSRSAVVMFIAALVLGPFPLAHALTVWLATPARRALSAAAYERSVELDNPKITIRGRLTMYALCITIAPTAYMAAIGVAARVYQASLDTVAIAVGVGFLAVSIFAALTTYLVATTFTRPVMDVIDVVRALAAQGDAQKLGRVPQLQRDELGVLVELTNQMLDRLDRTREERERALHELEDLAHSLERRVAERSQALDREIAERAKLELALTVAQRIQASVLPRRWKIDGLDIAARMNTASEVGGDYYEILRSPSGGWLAIGDVSGHGIGAGLIMLMLQSITATLVDAVPNATPRELVIAANRVLAENIRRRMGATEFVTFAALRYEHAGRVTFAGAHEEIIVWRSADHRCERIGTRGPWLGVSRNVERSIVEQHFDLSSGDVLVLYTDGITEAANEERTRFGVDRLCEVIDGLASASAVEDVADAIIGAARTWCGVLEDDMSVVVARKT